MRPPVPLVRFAVGLVLGLALALLGSASAALAAPALALLAIRPARSAVAGLLLGLALPTGSVAGEPPWLCATTLPALHEIRGEIEEAAPPAPDGTRAVMRLAWVDGTPAPPVGVRLSVGPGAGTPLLPGDRVRLVARLDRLRRVTNPGQPDLARRWRRRGIHLRGWVETPDAIEILTPSEGLEGWIAGHRVDAAASLDRHLDPDDAGLARALLLGDRGALAEHDRIRFRETGQGHLIAVSGLHVGLLLAALLFLLRRLGLGPRQTALLGLAAVLIYVPFAGAPASAVRAGAGASILFLGRILGRRASGPATLAAVAAGVLMLDPTAISDVALALSLAAVTGILLLTARLSDALVPAAPYVAGLLAPPRAPFRKALAVSLAAWLGTAPLLATFMGRLCLIAAPLSVVTVPIAAALVASGFLLLAAGDVPLVGDSLVLVHGIAADLIRMVLDCVRLLGLGSRAVRMPDPAWLVAWTVVLLAFGLGFVSRARHVALALVLLLALLHLPARADAPPDHPEMWLLDVGHGQSAVLRLPDGQTALLDCGRMGEPTVGRRIVLPALAALGVRRLDLVALSHADADHTSGTDDVLAQLPVERIAVPPAFAAEARRRWGGRVRVATRGDVLLQGAWGALRVLAPGAGSPAEDRASVNDKGLVLRVDAHVGIVLPGDRGEHGVEELLRMEPRPEAEVLVLPHHGLPDAGRERLLDAVAPLFLLASTPARHAPHLPPGTRATGVDGALHVVLRPDGAVVHAPFSPTRAGYDAARPMDTVPPLAWCALALLVVAAVAYRPFRWLTLAGAIGAWILGTASFVGFGAAGLAALFAPFVVANALGHLPGLDGEGPRRLVQVAANGIPALCGVLLALAGAEQAGLLVFLGALACLGADTCATEIGVRYGGAPRTLIGGRTVAPGEDGGVTAAGLAASVGGAFLAPLAAFALGAVDLATVGFVALAGVAAGLLDSLLGATLQYRGGEIGSEHGSGLRWLDNDAVNLVAGLAGATIALALAS